MQHSERRNRGRSVTAMAAIGMMGLAAAAQGDLIVQEGSLDGGAGGPVLIDVVLDQFDPSLGTLNEVRFDSLTAVIGGGASNGSGVPTQVFASLTADYTLDGATLGATAAIIDFTVPNTGPPSSFTLFDTDTDFTALSDAPDLAPWIGGGDVTMNALVEFIVSEDPPGSVSFGAGGSVNYTVTYDFTPIPAPAAGAVLGLAGLARGRRRRRD